MGTIEKANPYLERMFGYETNELNGQKIEVLIPAHLKEKHIGYRKLYIQNPQPREMGSNLNLMAVKKSGDLFPVEISLTFFETEGTRHIVSFVYDITSRKRAENDLRRLTEELESKVEERTRELQLTNEGLTREMERRIKVEAQIREMLEKEKELSELKSRFVSMASHEFRTPLGGILTSVSLIEMYKTTEDDPKREKHIQNIRKSVRGLTNILSDFLSLEKLDQGKITSSPVHFNFVDFINEVVSDIRETSVRKHHFVIHNRDQLIEVFQDRELIRNIAINLISNAVKYSPEESTIHIETWKQDKKVFFEVRDNGIGIPMEDQKHLFQRFYRGQNVTNLQGTGLGLSIVKQYLSLLNGEIEFRSVENKGSAFKVNLPMVKE